MEDESFDESSSNEVYVDIKPGKIVRGGTVRGKSITGRMSKFEDHTTKSQRRLNVIGAPLETLLNFDGQTRTLPIIFKNILDALRDDEQILKSQSLFRIDIESDQVKKIASQYTSPNLHIDLTKNDSDAISMLLLFWLSRLPDSLLTSKYYNDFKRAISKSDKVAKVAKVVKNLPKENINALKYLLLFLKEVVSQSQFNGLDVTSLSRIFGRVLHRKSRENESIDKNSESKLNEPSTQVSSTPIIEKIVPENEKMDKSDDEGVVDEKDQKSNLISENDAGESNVKEATSNIDIEQVDGISSSKFTSVVVPVTEVDSEAFVENHENESNSEDAHDDIHSDVVFTLLSGFQNIFSDFSIEDKEEIPEEQLGPNEIAASKRKKYLVRSTSTSDVEKKKIIEQIGGSMFVSHVSGKDKRKTMAPSASADHLVGSVPIIDQVSDQSLINPTPTGKAAELLGFNQNSSNSASPSQRSTTPTKRDAEGEEKEKKGLMGALRKLGFVKDKDRTKSPTRERTPSKGSNSSAPATPVLSPMTRANEEVVVGSAVFGMQLEQLLNHDGHAYIVPNILRDCISYLSKESRTKEFGIFRESGSYNEKMRLMKQYDSPSVHVDMEGMDPFTVANLVKEWLRALPDAVIPESQYKDFKEAVDSELDENESISRLKAAISKMEQPRRILLQYLINFLRNEVTAYSSDNMMTEHNVGIVFGPCLHRLKNASPTDLMDPCHNQIVVQILNHYEKVFEGYEIPILDDTKEQGAIMKKATDIEDNKHQSTTNEVETKPIEKSNEQHSNTAKADSIKAAAKLERKKKSSGSLSTEKHDLEDPFAEAAHVRKRSATTVGDLPTLSGIPLYDEKNKKVKRRGSSKNPKRENSTGGDKLSSLITPTISEESSVPNSPKATHDPNVEDASSVPLSPKGSPKSPRPEKLTTRKGSLSIITVDNSSTSNGTTPSPILSPSADAPSRDLLSTSAKKKRRKDSKLKENSFDASISAEQVETWLSENGFSDLVKKLKFTNGRQLISFTKADLQTELGIRGVALWNILHLNESQESHHARESSALVSQIASLEAKIEHLMELISSQHSSSSKTASLVTKKSSKNLVDEPLVAFGPAPTPPVDVALEIDNNHMIEIDQQQKQQQQQQQPNKSFAPVKTDPSKLTDEAILLSKHELSKIKEEELDAPMISESVPIEEAVDDEETFFSESVATPSP